MTVLIKFLSDLCYVLLLLLYTVTIGGLIVFIIRGFINMWIDLFKNKDVNTKPKHMTNSTDEVPPKRRVN